MLFLDSIHSLSTVFSAYNGFTSMWPYCKLRCIKSLIVLFSRNTETTPHTHIHMYTHVSLHTFIHAHLYIKKEPSGKTHMAQLLGHSLKFLDACGKTTQLRLLSHPVGCGGSSLRCRMLQAQESGWAAKNISRPALASQLAAPLSQHQPCAPSLSMACSSSQSPSLWPPGLQGRQGHYEIPMKGVFIIVVGFDADPKRT